MPFMINSAKIKVKFWKNSKYFACFYIMCKFITKFDYIEIKIRYNKQFEYVINEHENGKFLPTRISYLPKIGPKLFVKC